MNANGFAYRCGGRRLLATVLIGVALSISVQAAEL